MSGIRDGKDLLHNLTTSLVKYVFLPIEGSEPFTAFLQRKHPHFLLRSYFLGVLAVSHYGISLFSDSTRFQQLMAPYSLLLHPPAALWAALVAPSLQSWEQRLLSRALTSP